MGVTSQVLVLRGWYMRTLEKVVLEASLKLWLRNLYLTHKDVVIVCYQVENNRMRNDSVNS